MKFAKVSSAKVSPIKVQFKTFITPGAKVSESLSYLRMVRCMEMVSKSTKGLQPEHLPPTKDSAWQHSLRVYFQVMCWKTLAKSSLDPIEWGWYIKENRLEPVMSTQVSIMKIFLMISTEKRNKRKIIKIYKSMTEEK